MHTCKRNGHKTCIHLMEGLDSSSIHCRAEKFPVTRSRPTIDSAAPPTQAIPGILSPRIKRRVKNKVSSSHPYSAEAKNVGSSTHSQPYVFMASCLLSTCTTVFSLGLKAQLFKRQNRFNSVYRNCVAAYEN